MSTQDVSEGAQLARDALADIQLVAQLRGAFQEAQVVMGKTLADCNLSEQRYHLLLAVAAGGPQGTVQGSLASQLRCPESRISLLVRELHEGDLLETVRNASDRRQVRVRLSEPGQAILSQAITVQREALHSMIANLEVAEVTRLAELVARTYLGLDLTVMVRAPRRQSPQPDHSGPERRAQATTPAARARAAASPPEAAATRPRARDAAYRGRPARRQTGRRG